MNEAAHEDLEEALGYIAGDLANSSAAANLLDQMQAVYEQLKDFPMLYECCHDLRLRNLGYRKVVIGNFVLVYYPAEDEKRVYILRFFYGGRDYEKLIKKIPNRVCFRVAYAKILKSTLLGYFSAYFHCPIRVYPNGTLLTAEQHFLNFHRVHTIVD